MKNLSPQRSPHHRLKKRLLPRQSKWLQSKSTDATSKVAIEWAVNPVDDYDWPGAAEFAERIGAQIAKEKHDTKLVIR